MVTPASVSPCAADSASARARVDGVTNVTTVPDAPARPVRPAAVHVVLRVDRQVVLHHARHLVDVHTACRDVGGHQRTHVAGAEVVEGLVAMRPASCRRAAPPRRRATRRVASASRSAPCRVRTNTIVRSAATDDRRRQLGAFVVGHRPQVVPDRAETTLVGRFVGVVTPRAAPDRAGGRAPARRRRRRTWPRTAGSAGRAASARAVAGTSGRKPMSAIRSASSMTTTPTSASETVARSIRSSSRPGQATTMSRPPSHAAIWGSNATPP